MTRKRVTVNRSVQEENRQVAEATRARLTAAGVWCLNVMSSPGSGKTTLIAETVRRLKGELRLGVIAGDIETHQDARRLAEAGAPAEQVETHGACHLVGRTIAEYVDRFDLDALDVLVIENVGNLVCPIGWDLGEHARATLLSVPEGDDKPSKYPNCCVRTDVFVVTKVDVLDAFDFDLDRARRDALKLNPRLHVLALSARTGEGMETWLGWLRARTAALSAGGAHAADVGGAV